MTWSFKELFFDEGTASEIFWRIRLPRVSLGFLSGAALGAAGFVLPGSFFATP